MFILRLSIIAFLFSCNSLNPCVEKEIFRKTSQDNTVDVVILTKDCGATTSVNKSVYIVPKGELVKDIAPIFLADHVSNLEAKWMKPKFLIITYNKARIFEFTNFWSSKKVNNFLYEVTIREELINQ